ncbi:MAG: type II secretion system protein [Candidatus Woesebacteria bacterium]|nr:MAG: type II secretion system protein [Candidatus Woesebacteria bacterium]
MKKRNQAGILVVEVLLAIAIFSFFATGFVIAALSSLNANRLANEESIATHFASEGIEAMRSIKNQSYDNLTNTTPTTGVIKNINSLWAYGGANNSFEKYSRTITVSDVFRDGSGNIVSSGGALDPKTKKVTSTVKWNFSSARVNDVSISTYFTKWKAPILSNRSGILVYGDGGTTNDAFRYRIFDGSTNSWGVVGNIDFDTTTSNRAVRAVRVYSSSTRNEKIVISRHYNGTTQYIYGHVFNGTNFTSTLFSSWNANTFLQVRNFDGAYLANGNFVAVYSDNTTTPKYRIWNGSSWSSQLSLINLANNGSSVPLYIVTRPRSGTNEVMAGFFDQSRDVNTEYFNGSSWNLHSIHSTSAPNNASQMIDFVWSANNSTKGALIFSSGNNDRAMNIKIWTANGSGSGSWSNTANSTNQGVLGPMEIDSRTASLEFIACDRDTNSDIYCFKSDGTPSFSSPSNNILTTSTATGSQKTFDIKYQGSGDQAIAVYSDNSAIPKLKKYNPLTGSFDATATNLTSIGSTLRTVSEVALADSPNIMILMGDNNNRLYSDMWNGSENAFTLHGTNGSSTNEYWYDFEWDKN